MDLNKNGFNQCFPSLPDINLCSPNGSLILGNGIPMYNDVTIAGTGGEVITNIFTFDGEFILRKLWLIILDATDITTASGVYFDIWDGSVSVPLTLDGLDLSGVTPHSMAIKDVTKGVALTLLDADQVRFEEGSANKPFVEGVVGHKNLTTCYLRLRVTTDVNTDITVRVFMGYSPLDFSLILTKS